MPSSHTDSSAVIPYPDIDIPETFEANFKDRVIEIVKQIPYGKVTNYGTVAVLAGLPRGARLVGGILHFNSGKYDLAWYRVINKAGYISTRCENHTKQEQKALLESEGVKVSGDYMVDMRKYGWFGNVEKD